VGRIIQVVNPLIPLRLIPGVIPVAGLQPFMSTRPDHFPKLLICLTRKVGVVQQYNSAGGCALERVGDAGVIISKQLQAAASLRSLPYSAASSLRQRAVMEAGTPLPPPLCALVPPHRVEGKMRGLCKGDNTPVYRHPPRHIPGQLVTK